MSQPPPVTIRPTFSGLTGVDDLTAIEALAGTGLAARTGSNTWALRTITAGSGISVTNGDGVSGNPTIAWSGSESSSPSVLANGDMSITQRGDGSAFTASTTSGSASLTSVSSVANISVGQGLVGTGIPTGATIVSIDSATQITISANASATGSGVSITPVWHNNQFCNADRWLFLCASGASLSTPSSTFATGYANLVTTGSSVKKGLAQWVESSVAQRLAGRTVTFQCSVGIASGSPTFRCAILSWTGTADTLGSARDPVNDWTSTTYTAGNFFKSTTMSVVATGSVTGSSTPATLSCSGSIPSTANNICVMMWIDSTSGNPSFGFAELFPGSATRSYVAVPRSEQIAHCERFYYKTFALTQAPRTNLGNNQGVEQIYPSTTFGGCTIRYRQRMHRVPTMTIYNPQSASAGPSGTGTARDFTSSANRTVVLGTSTDTGVTAEITSGVVADTRNVFHFVADAEIQ